MASAVVSVAELLDLPIGSGCRLVHDRLISEPLKLLPI